MLALHNCFINFNSNTEYVIYTLFEEIIRDLEDKDVDVPFKAENVDVLLNQDHNNYCNILKELKASDYYDELERNFHKNYRIHYIKKYPIGKPYDFLGEMCFYSNGLVSELLCSNIEISKK